jgi:hypothetical protein
MRDGSAPATSEQPAAKNDLLAKRGPRQSEKGVFGRRRGQFALAKERRNGQALQMPRLSLLARTLPLLGSGRWPMLNGTVASQSPNSRLRAARVSRFTRGRTAHAAARLRGARSILGFARAARRRNAGAGRRGDQHQGEDLSGSKHNNTGPTQRHLFDHLAQTRTCQVWRSPIRSGNKRARYRGLTRTSLQRARAGIFAAKLHPVKLNLAGMVFNPTASRM